MYNRLENFRKIHNNLRPHQSTAKYHQQTVNLNNKFNNKNAPVKSTNLRLEFIIKLFPVWLRNRLISAGLGPVLSHVKSCIVLYPVFYEYKNVQA